MGENSFRNCKVVDVNEVADMIPALWVSIFREEDFETRKRAILRIWKMGAANELSITISFIEQNLVDVDLIADNGRIAVLYTFKNDNDETVQYEGIMPRKEYDVNIWEKLPQEIKKFYQYVHDGFFEYNYQGSGLAALENIMYLDDYEWEVVDALELNLEINLETSYALFSSGMGGYVVIDTDKADVNEATIWSVRKAPRYHKNMWDFVDEWILMCMNAA